MSVIFRSLRTVKRWLLLVRVTLKTLEVEPHVALGCGLAAAMFGPVHARSHQLDGCGIHNVDRLAEAVGHAPAPTPMGKAQTSIHIF